MPTIDIQELLEIEQQPQQSSFIKSNKQEMYSHNIFFDEDIGEPKKYRDLINLLYMAPEHTEVNSIFNSSGGMLTSAVAIIEAIKGSDATVRAIITGECHSAASIIALSCHEIVVTDSAHMLVHTGSYGTGGNVANIKAHADFSSVYINRLLDSVYSGFLTDVEMVNVKQGTEYWFDAKDIRSRLLKRQEYLIKKIKPKAKKAKVESTEKCDII